MIIPTSCGLPPGKFPACWTYESPFLLFGLRPASDIPRSFSFSSVVVCLPLPEDCDLELRYFNIERDKEQSESLLHILFGKWMSLLIL